MILSLFPYQIVCDPQRSKEVIGEVTISPTLPGGEGHCSYGGQAEALLLGGAAVLPFPPFSMWNHEAVRGHRPTQITTPSYSVFAVHLPRDNVQAQEAIAQHIGMDRRWLSFAWQSTRHVTVTWHSPPCFADSLERMLALATSLLKGAPKRMKTNAQTIVFGARVSRKHGATAATSRPDNAAPLSELNHLLSSRLSAFPWTSLAVANCAGVPLHMDTQNRPGRATAIVALDCAVWIQSHSQVGTLGPDHITTPMAWNQLRPGHPFIFDSTRLHAIASCRQATLIVMYSPKRDTRPE
eukprot:6487628-Amphidinium_carterae.2